MPNSILSTRGRITIPKEMRDAWGLKAGDRVAFRLMSDGTVIVRPEQSGAAHNGVSRKSQGKLHR
jgi:AbrB family looped-hinge helix DNA binding protein